MRRRPGRRPRPRDGCGACAVRDNPRKPRDMTVADEQIPVRDPLDDKVARVFAGKVVRRDLVRKVKVGANVPVFVLEYLLGKYCATDDNAAIEAGMRVVNNTLSS